MASTLPRNAPIDLLRGIAVVLVMLLHYSLTYRLPDSVLGDLFTPKGVARVVMNGNYGVTMFFVISGYLITTNSLGRWTSLERMDRLAFYKRRARRIVPPLLVAVAIILDLGSAGRPSFANKQHGEVMDPGFWWLAIGSVLTFWHNVLMQSEGYFNYALNIYWSLSVEEVFYLLFPVVATLLPRRAFLLACAAMVVAGPVYRSMHVERELDYLYGYLACFDAIAIGCLLAFVAPQVALRGPWPMLITVLATVVLAVLYLSGIGGNEVFVFTGIALSTAVIILFNARWQGTGKSGRSLAMTVAPLRWMGRHSYELYLFHIIVLGLMRDAIGRDQLARGMKLPWMLLFLGLSALVSLGMGRFAQRWNRAGQ